MSAQSSRYHPDVDQELDWWSLTPAERWTESQKLWATFLALGGSFDPEPDWQSPFYFEESPRSRAAHGRSGKRRVRGRGVQPRHRSGGRAKVKKP
jgi:hypothetical protein